LRLAPDDVINYSNLAFTYVCLNRLDEAKSILDEALARKLDGSTLHGNLYDIAFLRDDAPAMGEQVAWYAGRPDVLNYSLEYQSNTERYYGHLSKARDLARRAVESALRLENKDVAGTWQVGAALQEAALENVAATKQAVTQALAMSSTWVVKAWGAYALAQAGDVSRAKALADELGKIEPQPTMLKSYWLPTVKAAIDVDRRDSAQALLELEATVPYELSADGSLDPGYVRGQAYLLAHNGKAAAAEFQELIDHRGLVTNFVTGALAHLYIARAHAMAGDTAKAKAAYQDFFTLWKDADPYIPILKQAKAEYAKLE
jgi:eukaryotic-like serine/threonine-protein kinase